MMIFSNKGNYFRVNEQILQLFIRDLGVKIKIYC